MENDLDLKMPIGTNPIQDLKKEMNADEKMVSYQMIESAKKLGKYYSKMQNSFCGFPKIRTYLKDRVHENMVIISMCTK